MISLYNFFSKKGQAFAIGLGVLVVAIFLFSVIGGLSSNGYDMGSDLNQILKNDKNQTFSFFDIGIQLTMVLVVIAALLALAFGIIQMFSNLKGSMTGIIGLVVIAAIFFGLYSSMPDDLTGAISPTLETFDISSGVSKLISGGIGTSLLLSGICIGAMVILEIWNAFK